MGFAQWMGKVMKVLQQVWAQACKHDLTFFMLTTYLHSVIMLRDRKSQSLYISDTLEIGVGTLNIIEVTLAMTYSAMEDMRARLGGEVTDPGLTPNPPLGNGAGGKSGEHNPRDKQPDSGSNSHPPPPGNQSGSDTNLGGSYPTGSGNTGSAVDEMPALFLYFRCGIYQSPFPALLQRRQLHHHNLDDPAPAQSSQPGLSILKQVPNNTSPGDKHLLHTSDPDSYPSAFIYALAGQGSGGDVWRAKLMFPSGIELSVVVKIGEQEDLRREELAYERLMTYGATGVPKFLGSFSTKNDPDTTYIVLEDVGSPITSIHHPMEQSMSQSELDELVRSLESIHNAGVVHGDLEEWNLLEKQGPDGARIFTIVDFHLAEVEGETMQSLKKAQESEVRELRMLLDPWVEKKGKGNRTLHAAAEGRSVVVEPGSAEIVSELW